MMMTMNSTKGVGAHVNPSGGSLHDQPLRSGCWTQEEMDYVNALMTDFRDGALLGVAAGTTLRGYLAKNVHCGVKRVSKKLEGTSYNGRLTFKVKHHFSTAELRFRCERLALLRAKFERSVAELKIKEAQNKEDGNGGGDERKEGEVHHFLPPPRASLSLQDNALLGSAFGSSIEDVLLEEARSRYLGASAASLLQNNRMPGILTNTSMVPGLFDNANHGLPGSVGNTISMGDPRVAAFQQQQQQQQQQQSLNSVLESIRMRRSAISGDSFANAGGGFAHSSATSLVSAALMRQNAPSSIPMSSLSSFAQNDARLTEILRRSQDAPGFAEASLDADQKRSAADAGLLSGSPEKFLSEGKSQPQEQEPTNKRTKFG